MKILLTSHPFCHSGSGLATGRTERFLLESSSNDTDMYLASTAAIGTVWSFVY